VSFLSAIFFPYNLNPIKGMLLPGLGPLRGYRSTPYYLYYTIVNNTASEVTSVAPLDDTTTRN